MFRVEFENGGFMEYENPIKIKELISSEDYNYFACKVNNKLRDFEYEIKKNCKINFVGIKDRDANKVYESSLRFILLMAAYNVDKDLSLVASFNVSRSTVLRNKAGKISAETFKKIEAEMNRIVEADYPIVRKTVSKKEAIDVYSKLGFLDKLDLMKYRPEDEVHIYSCDGYQNYLYSYMTPSTGYLTKYKLIHHEGDIVLMYPRSELGGEIPEFIDEKTYAEALSEVRKWGIKNKSSTVTQINEHVEHNEGLEFVLACEERHSLMLEEVADRIINKGEIGLIAIAGPSSSGKTTFSNRLKAKLMEKGLNPVVISMDDYYIDRDLFDFDSITDFEDINLLDLPLFNQHMKDLIDGKEVDMPKFDFATKKRVKGKKLKLDKNSPIVIEGIHALNKRTTESIPANKKFKIYIGPQIQVNLDDSNPISITNLRLIRRIVRDYQFRGSSAENTLKMWESVRNGEFKWIYENQEGVDFVFNSQLDYEFCVTKKHILPLLENIGNDSSYYNLASTLKKYVKYFKDIDDGCVPHNSLLREFIGGSCFNV